MNNDLSPFEQIMVVVVANIFDVAITYITALINVAIFTFLFQIELESFAAYLLYAYFATMFVYAMNGIAEL